MKNVTLDTSGLTRFVSRLRPNVEAATTRTVTSGIAESQRVVRKDTHALEQSIVAGGSGLEQDWGSSLSYAAAQEFGLDEILGGRRYGYTPYLKPTAEALRDEHTQHVADAVKQSI